MGYGTTTPVENVSQTSDQAPKPEGGEQSEECVRPEEGKEEEEEGKKEQRSSPNPQRPSRDNLACEDGDATQSAHSEGSAVSGTDTGGGGSKEAESVGSSERSAGQGQEREESSSSTSESGNPERNASHLTHLPFSAEQGVVQDSDLAHTEPAAQTQAQAKTSKRLHVYLEDISVIHCPGSTARQEVVRTKVTTSLQILPRAKSEQQLSSIGTDNQRTETYSSALAGVLLTSHKESQSKPDETQTEADSMGRKNAARRKVRKNSQGDAGSSPQAKLSPKVDSVPKGVPGSDKPATSPQGKGPQSHVGESALNSSYKKHDPASEASPEAGESATSGADTHKQLGNIQGSSTATVAALTCSAGMEDDDSLYQVQRKTETPESKRRSIKVSHSEVKFFPKCVSLNAKQSRAGEEDQVPESTVKNVKGDAKEKAEAEIETR